MVSWTKWILDLLPVRLRNIRLFVLLQVLISPIPDLYGKFTVWKARVAQKASVIPQVCMLKKIVYDDLGIIIDIEEGDGKPVDFIIKASFPNVDKERQLFALLERYKLAGKSYSYSNTEVAYECIWNRYVCEKMITNNILFTFYWTNDGVSGYFVYKLTIQADYPVQSDLDIELTARYPTGGEGTIMPVNLQLMKGQSYYEIETWMIDKVISVIPSPAFDDMFMYNVKTKDIYE